MSRILLTWELGLNFGHLTRLLALAERLKAEGHVVLVATRDIQAATRVLGPAGIPFVQAPLLARGIPLEHRPGSYADVLLSQGWIDKSLLSGLVYAWLALFRLFRPERLVLDYSPTVSLAARIAKLPTVLIGNGFELPPATAPLPPFPGFPWATLPRAVESERMAVAHANAVLSAHRAVPLTGLRDLVVGEQRLLATLPELDHYGPRTRVRYIGPLLGHPRAAPSVPWPAGEGPRIFVCVRPDTNHIEAILQALNDLDARIICVAGGFHPRALARFNAPHMDLRSGLVDLSSLADADLCVTYGAEGTLLRFLLMGVPQLISPWHVETYMAARRVEAAGLGASLGAEQTADSIATLIRKLTTDTQLRERTRAFAARAVLTDVGEVASIVLGEQRELVEACA
jgi:UDP:flavonoid glycosyltransferase YjiC (YdhE family)